MENRLRYEFAYLANTTSTGYTDAFPGLSETGSTPDGAKWFHLDPWIDQPDKLVMSFGKDEDQTEQLDSTGVDKAIATNLELFGVGYSYVKAWLIDHPDAFVNSIQVRITDLGCDVPGGKPMGIWEIKQDSIFICLEGECNMDIVLKEYNPLSNCLQNTLVTDDHRHWFPIDGVIGGQTDPISGGVLPTYFHPNYRYCDDIKPQFLQNFIFVLANSIVLLINPIVTVIQWILDFINWVITQIGGSFGGDENFADAIDDLYEGIYSGLLGCGRSHIAPFIRNYFINACSKCGVDFASNVFNEPGGEWGVFYHAGIMNPTVFKGLKENTVDDGINWQDYNGYSATPITLAYDLKDIFNLKFKLEDKTFSIHSKDKFPPSIVFDFTLDTDKALVLDYICIGRDAPAREALTKFTYGTDAIDMAGNEAKHRYNGTKYWTDGLSDPDKWNFNGIKEITTDKFAPVRFTNDGVDRKLAFKQLDDTDFWPDGLMLLEKDVTTLAKIIIWDGVSDFKEAQAIKMDILDYPYVMIPWNRGTDADWAANHYINIDPNTYWVYNYPMYFDTKNSDDGGIKNIYDLHKIDNPVLSGKKIFTWNCTIELCCDTLNRLIYDANLGDGVVAKIDHLVRLTSDMMGRIERVVVDYEKNEIKLSGTTRYAN